VADEWFRSPRWDEAARADFEARLARARSTSRPQYLFIKALSVEEAGEVAGARELFTRAAEHPEAYLFQRAGAWEKLAELAARSGDRETAERLYRRILTEQPSLSGTSNTAEIALAELLLDDGDEAGRDEALQLLTSWIERDGLKFNNQLLRWHLAYIRIAEAIGDKEWTRRAARTALDLASRGPQLPRHKDVGLVHADKATLRRLHRLAR
jgi:tetratricopeptide (TPR) repeat protein